MENLNDNQLNLKKRRRKSRTKLSHHPDPRTKPQFKNYY